jgi:hypothetical protein
VENDTKEVIRAAVYFMLSGCFGVLMDLVGDYLRRNVVAATPYLYIFSGPMRALYDLGSNYFKVQTLGLDWARKQAFPVFSPSPYLPN